VTSQIIDFLPQTGIIILSAQDDKSYMRLAMIAGAKAFLTKPPAPDELYHTVRAVYSRTRAPILSKFQSPNPDTISMVNDQDRAGNIITVYSPQGGAGCTTIATNLASALNREKSRVLLVDANLQFGDIGVFLNLDPRSTLLDLVDNIDDLDVTYFENVLTTHNSGLKVLMGPGQPELAEKVSADPKIMIKILTQIRRNYDFIVVDTSLHLDDMLLSILDMTTRILLVSNPTLPSVKNIRFVLDLFEQIHYSPDKIMLILNRVSENQTLSRLAITPDKIGMFLKHSVDAIIPTDEVIMLDAIRKGIPAITLERDRSKPFIKELFSLSDLLLNALMPNLKEEVPKLNAQKKLVQKVK
jgi:pilus assembly protein CpaE